MGKLVGPCHRKHFPYFFETKDFGLLCRHDVMFSKCGKMSLINYIMTVLVQQILIIIGIHEKNQAIDMCEKCVRNKEGQTKGESPE